MYCLYEYAFSVNEYVVSISEYVFSSMYFLCGIVYMSAVIACMKKKDITLPDLRIGAESK